MNRKYNFISGLPRSGSTLLSAILKQNPRFTTGISDPLELYVNGIIKHTESNVGMSVSVDVDKRKNIIRSLFDSFYEDGNEVCFNTNRGWASQGALLEDLFPNFKMIICVRDIPWILDSFEILNEKNPYTIKPLYHHLQLNTVQERCHMLMGAMPNYFGYVAGPLECVQHAMYCTQRNNMCFLDYDTLVKHPRESLTRIYDFLDEPWFEHDFDNVEDSYDEFDVEAKIIGLHTIRKKVEYKQRRTIIPQVIWNQYEQSSFWNYNLELRKELNWIDVGLPIKNANKYIHQYNKRQL